MALRYPSSFTNGMPFIFFQAFKYNCPVPDVPVLNKLNSKDKIGSTIALYMPGEFTESANAQWGLENVYQQGNGGNAGAWVLANTAEAMQNAGAGKLVSSIEAAGGRLPFPTDILIFKAIDPLSFNLSFTMIPFDKEEGDNIVEIITNFKKAMMPSVDGTSKNTMLLFPPVWDIQFEGINGLGITQSKYESMALTQCSVSYVSGTEGASVYPDKNPTQVKLNLSFQSIRKFFLP